MNQAQRDEFLAASRAHLEADMLQRGTYGKVEQSKFKGCSVGCHVRHIAPDFNGEGEGVHKIVADHYGYPEWLVRLQDAIFEGLPHGDSEKWHVQLAEALHSLPDDYDWQAAYHRVHVAILRIAYRTARETESVVQRVIDLHDAAGSGGDVSKEMWAAARSAAYQEIRDGVLAALEGDKI